MPTLYLGVNLILTVLTCCITCLTMLMGGVIMGFKDYTKEIHILNANNGKDNIDF